MCLTLISTRFYGQFKAGRSGFRIANNRVLSTSPDFNAKWFWKAHLARFWWPRGSKMEAVADVTATTNWLLGPKSIPSEFKSVHDGQRRLKLTLQGPNLVRSWALQSTKIEKNGTKIDAFPANPFGGPSSKLYIYIYIYIYSGLMALSNW